MDKTVMRSRERFAGLVASLDAMSPLKVISRGYSIVSDSCGKIIKKTGDVGSGEKISVRVEDGNINCTVD
jgi:exodeoxyribonuclease VII large subunit